LVLYPSKKKADLYSNLEDTRKGLLAFVAQLKAGKGLTLVAECVEGQFAQMAGNEVEKTKDELYEACKASRIRGFCDVLVAEQYIQGVSHLIQTSGLGGLRHNRYEINQLFMDYSFKNKIFSVLCAWPEQWSVSNIVGIKKKIICFYFRFQHQNPMKEASLFAQMVRTIAAAGCAILVPKYASSFPTQGERLNGTIDIYWVRIFLSKF
jgi:potassium/chloride transporter 4/5/6